MSSLFEQAEMRRLNREAEREMNNKGSYTDVRKAEDATVRFDKNGAPILSAKQQADMVKPAVAKQSKVHREGESYVVANVRLTKTAFGISASFATGAEARIVDLKDAIRAMFDHEAEQADAQKAEAEKPGKAKK